jgi:carboxylesterase type B
MESGPINDWISKPLETAYSDFEDICSQLGCENNSNQFNLTYEGLGCLRSLNASSLLLAKPSCKNPILCWTPVVDFAELPDEPTTLAASGNFSGKYNAIIGINMNEGTLFTADLRQMTTNQYEELVESKFGVLAAEILALYPSSSKVLYHMV